MRAVLLVLLLAACAERPSAPQTATRPQPSHDPRVPPFALGYDPFSREAVVAIARREWRLFGSPVDDDPPDTRPEPLLYQKPERQEGLWQRVGEYWWLGVPQTDRAAAWTGKHDEAGRVFPAPEDGSYAWSAAFVGYVMRVAGAADRFPYAAVHATYINAAASGTPGLAVAAERPGAYAPLPGDLICEARGRAGRALTYEDLPAGIFPAHCDIVVDAGPGQISVLGGNVDDAVTMKHVPVGPDGRLADPSGHVLDARYPWLIVLRLVTAAAPGA